MKSSAAELRLRAAVALGTALASSWTTAHADDNLSLEEVIVTAQKRAENIQNVPIAITALSADALAEKGVTNVADISNFTPNIQIDRSSPFAGSSTIISAYIRGIGQNDFAFNLDPGVGLYVDGVYYARTVGAAIDLLDVERVEVLKGPQGTLFGRNTIGGALHVITRKPSKDFDYQGDLTVGNYNRQTVRGAMDIPLVEGLLYSSISFSSTQRDGYQQRIAFDPTSVSAINPITNASYTGSTYTTDNAAFLRAKQSMSSSDTQGGVNSRTARVKLLFTPSDDVEFLLSGDLTNAREESTPMTLIKTYSNAGTLFGSIYNVCAAGLTMNLGNGDVCAITRNNLGTSLNGVAATRLPYGSHFITGDIDKSYATGANFSDVRTWGLSGTLDWQLSDAIGLKSITAYRNLDSKFGQDDDGSPIAMVDTSFTMDQTQLSEELQLNINAFSDHLKSVVGGYYFTEKGHLLDTVTFGEGLIQIYGPNDFKTKASAVFTHNNLAVTDQFGLTFGARYTQESKDFIGGQRENNDFVNRYLGIPAVVFPDPSDTKRLFPLGNNSRDFTNTSVRAGAEYKITPDVMAYASFAQGYKSGGWNTRLAVPLAVSVGAGAPIDATQAPEFDPEKANTYEVGLKSELLERRLRLNTAVFRTDYKDMQLVLAPAFAFGAPWFFNAGQARIQGFEIETDAKLSANFTLNAAVGYLDAQYTSLSSLAIASGMTLQHMLMNVPKWSGNVGGTYTVSLANDRALALHADYIYKDKMARDTLNTPELIAAAFGIVNASLSYGPEDGNWQVVLAGENLTDERYMMSGNHNTGVGAIAATYSAPRMWTLGFKIKH